MAELKGISLKFSNSLPNKFMTPDLKKSKSLEKLNSEPPANALLGMIGKTLKKEVTLNPELAQLDIGNLLQKQIKRNMTAKKKNKVAS